MVSAWPEPPSVIPAEWPAERTAGAITESDWRPIHHKSDAIPHSWSYACCPCRLGYENHALTFATRHTANFEHPVRSPHQIHISRIYFIGRQIESLPNGLAPHRPFR